MTNNDNSKDVIEGWDELTIDEKDTPKNMKDSQEVLQELRGNKKLDPTDLPEAPASVTYTIQTGTGFNCLFTLREMNGADLLRKMSSVEKSFAELGIVPQVKRSFGGSKPAPKAVDGVKCPKCGSDVVEGTTKAGKVFHKCSTQKYFNGQVSGCDYVNWEP